MPKINLENVVETSGTDYPNPYDTPCIMRRKKALGDYAGLTQFGAHIITLPPGSWSSQRHWHSAEDEFIMILEGHPTFIDDHGETELAPGDITAHPANDGNGHHMQNRAEKEVCFLIIGTRNPKADSGHYPDIDLAIPANGTPDRIFTRKDGSPY